ncbi:MAG: hypothetical protein J6B89_03330 [Bacilli bacterium]|nr:hypothetical protein [Bacilli bacterium]
MKEVKKLKFNKEVLNGIEIICRFTLIPLLNKKIININEIKITYVSPHIITAGKNNCLIFNVSYTLFLNDYSKSIKLKRLKVHIKTN